MSDVTREYIAGILCAMQVAGDDEASAAIEKFIVQLEAENAKLKREIEALREYIEAEGELPMCYETQEAAEKSYELKKKMDALLTGEQDG